MSASSARPIEVFISYSHKDEVLRDKLGTHLSLLRRQGVIDAWHDRRIGAGQEWAGAIDEHLNSAAVILLLVSPDFLASDYCYDLELKRALQRHDSGDARVIPVILRSVDWRGAPFDKLQALPRDAKPVTSWPDEDEAFTDVARGIRRVVEELRVRPLSGPPPTDGGGRFHGPVHPLFEVFKKSGVPHITFVPPDRFEMLKLAIAQPGRPVVIEGPSGVGKTTAVNHALSAISTHSAVSFSGKIPILSAREPADLKRISTLSEWHHGAVAIDDVHRLEGQDFVRIADYLKLLADKEDKKLIVIGIPNAGHSLIDVAFDLATRIDTFSFGRVTDDRIQKMIELGERALNISFDRPTEIIRASAGSFNMAQYLCFCICAHKQVLQTQETLTPIRCDVEGAVKEVLEALDAKFQNTIRSFASINGGIGLRVLQELAQDDDNFLSLGDMKYKYLDIKNDLERIVKSGAIKKVYEEFPQCEKHIFYDNHRHNLAVDDHQMGFYLRHTSKYKLQRLASKESVRRVRGRIFVSYSHQDREHIERLRTHFAFFESEGTLDVWSDKRISLGSRWRVEIERSIDLAKVAILLISADYLASPFIRDVELPQILARARENGLVVIPVIVGPCSFRATALAEYQSAKLAIHERQVWLAAARG